MCCLGRRGLSHFSFRSRSTFILTDMSTIKWTFIPAGLFHQFQVLQQFSSNLFIKGQFNTLQLSHKTHDGNISVRFHTICWQGLQRVKLRLRNNYPSPTMISITKRSPVRGRLNIRYSTANVEAHYNIPFCLRCTQALSVKFCSNRE